MSAEGLNVIALISGGKDSFFSVLHCLRNGHRVVALANLYPSTGINPEEVEIYDPSSAHPSHDEHEGDVQPGKARHDAEDTDTDLDLNSFMYQTVGHQVIPLYGPATGIPLYRRQITGGAVQEARDYDGSTLGSQGEDETESMVPLLREVMRRHPDANAVCAGAILSTYQRTRVESVAVRLGLVPLAFLWKFPVLPPPSAPAESPRSVAPESKDVSVDGINSMRPNTMDSKSRRKASMLGPPHGADDAQLLWDMASARLDARIIKVASAGLDESFLWERISSGAGLERARKALRRFGNAGGGAVLGEGGEFETVVVDGPPSLFQRRIVVSDDRRRVVSEGGGCAWLRLEGAHLEDKDGGIAGEVRVPEMLDRKFEAILSGLLEPRTTRETGPWLSPDSKELGLKVGAYLSDSGRIDESHWSVKADPGRRGNSIEDETSSIVEKVRSRLQDGNGKSYSPTIVTNTVILLRRMADFPAVNRIYGSLFPYPNPPSRVTVSCGDSMLEGCNIVVCLTLRRDLAPKDRNGLHVQSRSYWAPANIGPYSQAIDVPIQPGTQGPRMVSIAGQIPLVPSTMNLPDAPEMSTELQIVLSLQHLWRIGIEMKVQLWTSGVAYLPLTAKEADMARQARLAARAWRQAHRTPQADDDDGDEDGDEDYGAGPDPWDRKYNPEYMVYDQPEGPVCLPDWEAFQDVDNGEKRIPPPFYAVEVAELPRAAGIEWHAHVGLAGVEPGSAQMAWNSQFVATDRYVLAHHTVVKSRHGGSFIHSVLALGPDHDPTASLADIWEASVELAGASLGAPTRESLSPYLVYADSKRWQGLEGFECPIIPCKSIYSEDGKRVNAVGLFRCASIPVDTI